VGVPMKRPAGRVAKRIGACYLKEAPYKDEWRVDLTARNPRLHRTFHTWRHAEQFAKEETARRQNPESKSAFTFDDAADGWMKQQELRTRSKSPDLGFSAFRTYQVHLRKLRKDFGPKLLYEIESRDVQNWLLEQAAHYKHSSQRNHMAVLKGILDYARTRKMIDLNPLRLDRVKVPGKHEKRADIPAHSDMEVLREYISDPTWRPFNNSRLVWSSMRVAIVLAGTCGFRRGEVCGFCWDDINRIQEMAEIEVKRVITDQPLALKPYPKTEAGKRKVPLILEAQRILNEHAAVYEEYFAKCVGHIIRDNTGKLFVSPRWVGETFRRMMRGAELVKEDGKPKFSFHALRHYSASCWLIHNSTIGGIEQVSRWLGHKNTSETLDTYGHCIHDPDAHAKFLKMPSWLSPTEIEVPALPAPETVQVVDGDFPLLSTLQLECPIDVPEFAEKWITTFLRELWKHGQASEALRTVGKGRSQLRYELQRCGLPTIDMLEAIAVARLVSQTVTNEIPVVVNTRAEDVCPIDLPDCAAAWLKPFIRYLDQGLTEEAACQAIRKAPKIVRTELWRLKLPTVRALKRSLRNKKIMELYDRGCQDRDIARALRIDKETVTDFRREMRLPNADAARKRLTRKGNSPPSLKEATQQGGCKQLKLL
jgi:integrase